MLKLFGITIFFLCCIRLAEPLAFDHDHPFFQKVWEFRLSFVIILTIWIWIQHKIYRFHLDQVLDYAHYKIDEILITDAKSMVTCKVCKAVMNKGRALLKMKFTPSAIADVLQFICDIAGYDKTVCKGIMHLIIKDLIEAVGKTDMTETQICSFILIDVCPNGDAPRHQWNVKLPLPKHSERHPVDPPQDNKPKLKVLQIGDIHLDTKYNVGAEANCNKPLCCREVTSNPKTRAKKWGMYEKCDSPIELVENTFKHIAETHKDLDYIIYTGDAPAHDIWAQTLEGNLDVMRKVVDLFAQYFEGIPVFMSVGNHEACPLDSYAPTNTPQARNASILYRALYDKWKIWLPENTEVTIEEGAYYSILIRPGFRLIAINGNFCSRMNFWLLINSVDPHNQLKWLVSQLEAAETNGEKVHIIGHMPPGQSDCVKVWSRNYHDIINRFESTIMAQYFGHTHYDEFEVFYDKVHLRRPINVGYIAPSITPWELTDPSYRIYYVDGDHPDTTRAIVDIETYKMDLEEANRRGTPQWTLLYNTRQTYEMASLLPSDWDNLITRMCKTDTLFETYQRYYYGDSKAVPRCNLICKAGLLRDVKSGKSGKFRGKIY